MLIRELEVKVIAHGTLFPETVQVLEVIPMGDSVKTVGNGLAARLVHDQLSAAQLAASKKDYSLYAVFNCAAMSKIHAIQAPVKAAKETIVKVEHDKVGAEMVFGGDNE